MVTGALIFAQISVSLAKYQDVVRKCVLKSLNASELGQAPGLWGAEIQTSVKTDSFWAKKTLFLISPIRHSLFKRIPMGLDEKVFSNIITKKLSKLVKQVQYKNYKLSCEKTGFGLTFTWCQG